MVVELKQSKDVCIDKLTSTAGRDLEIMANLTSQGQVQAAMSGLLGVKLNSKYRIARYEMLLRLSVSWQGRGRDDLTGIGKIPDIQGWTTNNIGDMKQ